MKFPQLQFTPGVKIYFRTMVEGKGISRPGAWTTTRINKGAIAEVLSYDRKNTPDISDDWVKVKIISQDEDIGKTCYIPIKEFIEKKIIKKKHITKV